jgi:SsrA-binding protein
MELSGKVVATNRRARHDYFIEETYEAGLSLLGTEVKSLRAGRASIKDGFARIENREVYLYNMHIPPYEYGNIANHDPTRTRKLLLNKVEIRRLTGKVKERGYTLIPLKVYFKRGYAKVELALAKGKLLYDKRRALAEKAAKREVERVFKERQKSS